MFCTAGTVDIIILAAGASRRFGIADKLLAPFCGVPMVRHAAQLALDTAAREARLLWKAGENPPRRPTPLPPLPEDQPTPTGIQNIFFVYASNAVLQAVIGMPVTPILNKRSHLGRGESVRLGVLASRADFYLFLPADQPLLNPDILLRILETRAGGHIVVPTAGGRPQTPSLFSAAFRGELLSLPGGQPAAFVKGRHPEQIIPLPFLNEQPFADVDTAENLMCCANQYVASPPERTGQNDGF